MRTRSNSAFGAIIQSARRTSRRFSLGPVNNRSETIDLETQIEAIKENKEVLKIRKECQRKEIRRKRRDFNRSKSLSVSSYHHTTYDTIPHEAMGVAVVLLFIAFVVICLYFAELEIQLLKFRNVTLEASGQN